MTTTLTKGENSDIPRGRRPGRSAWLLLASLVLWLFMFVIAPTAILLAYSFFRGFGAGDVRIAFTLDNYRRAFSPVYLDVFSRSIGYAALTTGLCVLIGYPVAYYIGRSDPRRRNLLLLLVMVPFLTSFLIRAYAWFAILRDRGVLNSVLEGLRIIPVLIPGRLTILYTPAAVIIGLVYTYLPFVILPIYGSVQKLDESLLEAASDLGAGPVRTFGRVILPLTWPGVAAGILLVFVPSVAMFAVTTVMGGAKVRLIGDVIEDQFTSAGDAPFGSALGILLLALFLSSFVIFSLVPGGRTRV